MLKKLKRIEVEERLKTMGLEVFTPQEFRDVFGVSQNTALLLLHAPGSRFPNTGISRETRNTKAKDARNAWGRRR